MFAHESRHAVIALETPCILRRIESGLGPALPASDFVMVWMIDNVMFRMLLFGFDDAKRAEKRNGFLDSNRHYCRNVDDNRENISDLHPMESRLAAYRETEYTLELQFFGL